MYSKGFCYKGEKDIEMWTPKWTPKIGVNGKKTDFRPHKHVKYAKKSGIYALILHNYPILVRSTGIEPAWSYPQDP